MTQAHGWNLARRFTTAAVVAAVVAGTSSAQGGVSQVTVTVSGGLASFDKSASIDKTPVFRLDGMYGLNDWLAVGPVITLGRPNTTGAHFVSVLTYGVFTLGDTVTFHKAHQPINVLNAAAAVRVRLPGEKFQPSVTGGIGAYTLFLDTQANRRATTKSGPSFNFGAGLLYAISENSGVAIDLSAMMFTRYDREKLDPRFREAVRVENTLYRELWPTPPANKSNVTNFTFTVGFAYVPQFFGGAGGGRGGAAQRTNLPQRAGGAR